MATVFLHLLNMSLTAGVLVVVVLLLRLAFCKAPRWIHCLLWALVAVRLLCPFTLESSLSLMPDTEAALSVVTGQPSDPQEDVVAPPITDTPVIDTPVVDPPVIDTPVIDTPVIDTPVTDTPVVDPPMTNTPVTPSTPELSVSTPTPEASVDPWQIAVAVASYVWLAGVVLLAAYAVFTTLRLRRRVREAARLTDLVWCCDHIRTPFILGVFRPRVYLPSDLSDAARESVVAHEQAHLHRCDHWWKPLGFLLLTVYWFNPLMWVAYILLFRDIEAACDERVVRNMNADSRRSYSEALLACSAPRRLVSACPLAFGETSVKSRVKSVLSYKKPTIWIIVAALLVSTVAGVCLLTDPKDKPAKEPDSKTDITDQPTNPDEDANSADPTAPLGLTHVIRTGLIDTGFIEYFGSSDVQQITSRTDLLAFLNAHHEEDMHWASVDWQIRDFDQFDDTFFVDNVLLLTYHGTFSGMHTPEVAGYTYSDDGTVLTVEFVEYHPSFVSNDLAAWLMFSGIKKTDLEGVTTITSHLLKEVPTDTYVAAFTEPTEHPETATEKWREFYEDWAGMHLREMLTRLNDGGWEDSVAINRALNFVGCVWIDGNIYYITHQFDGIMSTDGKVGWLTTEESVRVSWLFDREEDPIYQLIAKAKKVDGNHVLMECVESEWLTGDVWVDFSRFSVSTVKIGEHYRIFYDYMEVTDPPRVTPIRVMLAPVNGTTTMNPTVTNSTIIPTKPTTPTNSTIDPTLSNAPHAVPYVASRTFFSYGMLAEDKLDALYQQYAYDRNSGKDLPVIPITSRTQLNAFIEKYKGGFRGGYGLPSLETLSIYGDDFFANHMLLAVYHPYHSAPAYPQIVAIDHNGTDLVTVQLDIHLPWAMNEAVSQNFVLAEVPRDQVANADFRAVIREEKLVTYYWQNYTHPVMAGSGDEFVGSTSGSGWIDGAPWQLVRYITWHKAESTSFKTIGYFSMDDGKRYYVSLDGTTLFDGERIATLNAEQTAMMTKYIRGVAPVKADTYVTGKLVEWNQQSRYMTLEVTKGDSALGKRVRVYTHLMSISNPPAVGNTIAIAYDGFCETGSAYATIYGLFLVGDGNDYIDQGYETGNIPQTETNLEFWIAENVHKFDFSGYQERYGLFGGTDYYGTGYVPTISSDGQQIDPKHCVIYTVTSYPDYADLEKHVTAIEITDPAVYFYGISLDSSFEEFDDALTRQGFTITSAGKVKHTAKKGKCSITMTKDYIRIMVEVENRTGIIF